MNFIARLHLGKFFPGPKHFVCTVQVCGFQVGLVFENSYCLNYKAYSEYYVIHFLALLIAEHIYGS